MQNEEQFFDFAAEAGFTKHMGSLEATDELAELCHIQKGKHVLDVGCGAGATPVYLAQKYGCSVVGLDISARMIERSEELAARARVADKTSFQVADVGPVCQKPGVQTLRSARATERHRPRESQRVLRLRAVRRQEMSRTPSSHRALVGSRPYPGRGKIRVKDDEA